MNTPTYDRSPQKRSPSKRITGGAVYKQDDAIQADDAVNHVDLMVITPKVVTSLQRLIGNQAVQRWLGIPPMAAGFGASAPPQQTGIARGGAQGRYVTKAVEYRSTAANADKPVSDLLAAVGDYANEELERTGTPPVTINPNEPKGQGFFDFKTWAIDLNPSVLCAGVTTVGDVTDEQIATIGETIYHEARHAEQWFRMARLLAGRMRSDDSGWDRAIATLNIRDQMKIPPGIAYDAAQNPLYEGEGSTMFDEAAAWYKSVYGPDSDYRWLINDSTLQDDAGELSDILGTMDTAIPADYAALPPAQQQTAKTKFNTDIADANGLQNRLFSFKVQKIDPEITRLTGIAPRSDVENTMLGYLNDLNVAITVVDNLWPPVITNQAGVQAMLTQLINLDTAMDSAYEDFPEEADALPLGESIAQKIHEG